MNGPLWWPHGQSLRPVVNPPKRTPPDFRMSWILRSISSTCEMLPFNCCSWMLLLFVQELRDCSAWEDSKRGVADAPRGGSLLPLLLFPKKEVSLGYYQGGIFEFTQFGIDLPRFGIDSYCALLWLPDDVDPVGDEISLIRSSSTVFSTGWISMETCKNMSP